jgi:hypothetical protein
MAWVSLLIKKTLHHKMMLIKHKANRSYLKATQKKTVRARVLPALLTSKGAFFFFLENAKLHLFDHKEQKSMARLLIALKLQ